jgi:hypothetical protein
MSSANAKNMIPFRIGWVNEVTNGSKAWAAVFAVFMAFVALAIKKLTYVSPWDNDDNYSGRRT